MKISEYKKGDVILISFPKGVQPSKCIFLRVSSTKEKIQVKSSTGKLMWYGVEFVVRPQEGVADILEVNEPVLEKESAKAEEKLAKINKLKKAENRVDKVLTKKEKIETLIKLGKTNKEIIDIVGCDSSYPAWLRGLLFKAGEITVELSKIKKSK